MPFHTMRGCYPATVMQRWLNAVRDNVLGERRWYNVGPLPDSAGTLYFARTGGSVTNWKAASYRYEKGWVA